MPDRRSLPEMLNNTHLGSEGTSQVCWVNVERTYTTMDEYLIASEHTHTLVKVKSLVIVDVTIRLGKVNTVTTGER